MLSQSDNWQRLLLCSQVVLTALRAKSKKVLRFNTTRPTPFIPLPRRHPGDTSFERVWTMTGEAHGLLRDQPPRSHGSMSRTGEAGSRETDVPPPPIPKHGTGKHRDRLTRRVMRRTALSLVPLLLACSALVFTARHAANVASRTPTRRLSESHVGGRPMRHHRDDHHGANLGEASPDKGVAPLARTPDRITSDLTWARRFALAAELLKVPPAFDLDTWGRRIRTRRRISQS